jgi:hypothetical protein
VPTDIVIRPQVEMGLHGLAIELAEEGFDVLAEADRLVIGRGHCSILSPSEMPDPRPLRHSSFALECLGHDSQVEVAEPVINDLLPFTSQSGQRLETLAAGSLQGEVHVLERE